MGVINQIKEEISKLDDASVEKNGKYIYIVKDGVRTKLRAEINEETSNMKTAKELFAWILIHSLSCMK